jgi:superfamily I DNA/RNA helicase
VRRILGLAEHLPGLRRVDLQVNYRCPRPVVERAVRLVEHNAERFPKQIRPGPSANGALVLAPDPTDETVRLRRAMATWPDDGSTRAVLARTNRELLPAVAVCLELGVPFRAPRVDLLLESPRLDDVVERAASKRRGCRCWRSRARPPRGHGGPVHRGRDRRHRPASRGGSWRGRSATNVDAIRGGDPGRSGTSGEPDDDAALTPATAHATKGLEFDHVVLSA